MENICKIDVSYFSDLIRYYFYVSIPTKQNAALGKHAVTCQAPTRRLGP